MGALDFVYSVINFLILAAGLYLFAGKKAKRMLAANRERIEADLIAANEARKKAEALSFEMERRADFNRDQQELIMCNARAQAEANDGAYTEGVKRSAEAIISGARSNEELLRREMKARVTADAVDALTRLAKEELTKDEYAPSRRRLADEYVGNVGGYITAMPSDIIRMNEGGALSVTVTGCESISGEDMERVNRMLGDAFLCFECVTNAALDSPVSVEVGGAVFSGSLEYVVEALGRVEGGFARSVDNENVG